MDFDERIDELLNGLRSMIVRSVKNSSIVSPVEAVSRCCRTPVRTRRPLGAAFAFVTTNADVRSSVSSAANALTSSMRTRLEESVRIAMMEKLEQ